MSGSAPTTAQPPPPDGPDGPADAPDASAHDLGMALEGGTGEMATSPTPAPDGSSITTVVWRRDGLPEAFPPMEAPADPAPGRRVAFGKYELIRELGRGGMGVVYQARQVDLDRLVAVKMILASHLAGPEQVDRFYAEARAAAQIRSPHVVAIHEVGQFHGQHYFAMEYVAGPNLARALEIQGGPLPIDRAARLVRTVARAVALLHARGIVHRDLKPSNVLLDEGGEPRVTDFGLAKMLAADDDGTGTGQIAGTPSYMAPEQAAGQADGVGPLADVYSLGAILYELLTGRPPFRAASPLDTLVQVIEGEPPAPGRLRPGLPPAIEAICLKCLSKAPDDRYPSAEALADDLERFLQAEPVVARRGNFLTRLRRWGRREPALACRLGTMALCGAIVQADASLFASPIYDRRAYRWTIGVVALWALASVLCRAGLRRDRLGDLPRYAWAALDVALFTALVFVNHGLSTALVAGYFLLVTASGLWFRDVLVWFTTGLAVVGYGALVLIQAVLARDAPDSPYRHFVFASALAITGVIVAYQVKRVRALSHYYEHRPLP